MKFEQLQHFVQVCESGSFFAAAEKTYISRQALSKSIASLERELGTALFIRSVNGVQLSDVGEFAYHYARPLVTAYEQFQTDIANKIGLECRSLRLNLFSSHMYLFPASALESFDIPLHISELPPPLDLEKIRFNDLDASLLVGCLHDLDLDSIVIKAYKRVALVPVHHRLASKQVITFEDLEGESLSICMNHRDYDRFSALINQKGIQVNGKFISETNFMYELCSTSNRIGFNLDFIADNLAPKYKDLIAIPFEDPEFPLYLSLVFSRQTSHRAILQKLAAYIRQIIE